MIQVHTEAELLQHLVDSGSLVVAVLDLILLVQHQKQHHLSYFHHHNNKSFR